jgi:hypothetical protein
MATTTNPYTNYSAETLGYALEAAYQKLSMGNTSEALLTSVEQMAEALEQKRTTDFCQHGVYLYGDVSPSCWQCEA